MGYNEGVALGCNIRPRWGQHEPEPCGPSLTGNCWIYYTIAGDEATFWCPLHWYEQHFGPRLVGMGDEEYQKERAGGKGATCYTPRGQE